MSEAKPTPTNMQAAQAATQEKAEAKAAEKVGYLARLRAGQAKAAASGNGASTSRAAGIVLSNLRALSVNAEGLTMGTAARLIGADSTTRKGQKTARQALRDAQNIAVKAGDLAHRQQMGESRRRTYYLIPKAEADALSAEDRAEIRTTAVAYAFGTDRTGEFAE